MASALPNLNAHEARVFGVLVEKSLTTPEHYPLSLNAATTASNQKSNRDPVVDFMEAEVHVAFQGLVVKHLAGRVGGGNARTEKYRHNGRESLDLDDRGLAVLAELLMRGAQTSGELRARANRMSPLPTLEDLRAVLGTLSERGFVRRLPPAPGSRAERYTQCLSPTDDLPDEERSEPTPTAVAASSAGSTGSAAPGRGPGLEARVESLEQEVSTLRRDLSSLMEQLGMPEAETDNE